MDRMEEIVAKLEALEGQKTTRAVLQRRRLKDELKRISRFQLRSETTVGDIAPFRNPSREVSFWKGEEVRWALSDGRYAVAKVLDTVGPMGSGHIQVTVVYASRSVYEENHKKA